ncbi:MAG TPA: YcaO-related McrA-glycine thioamidation protein [Methanomicrobiales archaeon]|nr:YcaO-related McrA-glycine thioamidation protein [Methanomicrobiales archaeon]
MTLAPCKKSYREDTHRVVSPEETLARVSEKIPLAGITRVADITSLDRIGIPVFSSIRPTAQEGAVSVYNGKGATPTEARVSAVMEGIERYSAEVHDHEISFGTYPDLAAKGAAVDPGSLNLPRGANPEGRLPWVEAWDIVADEAVLVPAHAVFHPLPRGYPPLFRTNTNGLASGNTREEAVFHGLAEIVERDAWSLVEVTKKPGPRITDPPAGLPAELCGKFAEAKVEVTVRDITSDLGIPTCAAVSDDAVLRDPRLLTIGMGTHTSARIAFLRALTEVAQSRLTQIHGAREDTTTADLRTRMGYERVRRMNRYWFEADSEVPFSALPSWDTDDFLKDIGAIVAALGKAGMHRVLVADLTREEIGVPVVRVVVPGLEVFAMDNERIGARCRDAGRGRLSRPEP